MCGWGVGGGGGRLEKQVYSACLVNEILLIVTAKGRVNQMSET